MPQNGHTSFFFAGFHSACAPHAGQVTGLRVVYEAALPVAGLGPALNTAAHSGSPGDTVVSQGAFLLKSDVLRSKMGAGCAD